MKVYVVSTEVFSGSWGCEPYSYKRNAIVDDESKARKIIKKMADDLYNNKEQARDYWLICDVEEALKMKDKGNKIIVSGISYENEDYVEFSYEEDEAE